MNHLNISGPVFLRTEHFNLSLIYSLNPMREFELYHFEFKKKELNLVCLKEKPIWIENLRFKFRIITIILLKKNTIQSYCKYSNIQQMSV